MKNIFKNKIKGKSGFTLAEVLIAMLILLMVSAIVAAGIPSAKNAYEKMVLSSNAEVLLSTTVSALRNELGPATDISVASGNKEITYYNGTRGSLSKIELGDVTAGAADKKTIMIQRYVAVTDDDGKSSDPVRLISKTASTADLYATYSGVTYNDGIVTFKDLEIKRESGGTLSKLDFISIRVISG
jgi:prepilin-type N-terminal cleavage/methylation domain-containing protein